MKTQPGSVWWLMHHELRLYFRSTKIKSAHLVSIIVVMVLMHLIAIPIAFGLKAMPSIAPYNLLIMVTLAIAAMLFLMVSRGLIIVIDAVYTRGDMDLLLSAPLAPRSIIGVRAAAIATTLSLEFAILIWPFANVFVLFGLFDWFKAYLIVPAIGMLASSLSLSIGLGLFRLLGARRTRVVAQILAAFIGMCFMLLGQLPNLLRNSDKSKLAVHSDSLYLSYTDSALLIPAHWINAGLISTAMLTVGCWMILTATIYLLGERFIQSASESASVSVAKPKRQSNTKIQFSSGLNSILIKKELRLIFRDPALLTQLAMQSVYMLPLCILWWSHHGDGRPWFTLMIIVLLAQTASALAWITVAAEDSPDLLMTAPVDRLTLVRAKTMAALIPVLPFAALPVLALLPTYPFFGLLIALCASGCCIHIATRHTRNPLIGKRGDFKTRYKGQFGQGLIELMIITLWVSLCAGITWISPW